MNLLFKQRLFSWLDSYDVFTIDDEKVFEVKGQLSFGHCLHIHNAFDEHVGTVQQQLLSFMPRFELYCGAQCMGEIRKKLTLLRPVFELDYNGWTVNGDIWEWDYRIVDRNGDLIASIEKQVFNWTDTYSIAIPNPDNALMALMVVLAIDAAKCSQNS